VSEQTNGMNGTNGNKVAMDLDLDREVIRCKTAGSCNIAPARGIAAGAYACCRRRWSF